MNPVSKIVLDNRDILRYTYIEHELNVRRFIMAYDNDDLLVTVKVPAVRHTYYVSASVHAREDWNTKQVTVTGLLGIAPDAHTIIEYPVTVWSFGYWNRTRTRKVVAMVERRFLAECKAIGYAPKDFTEPLEISVFWER